MTETKELLSIEAQRRTKKTFLRCFFRGRRTGGSPSRSEREVHRKLARMHEAARVGEWCWLYIGAVVCLWTEITAWKDHTSSRRVRNHHSVSAELYCTTTAAGYRQSSGSISVEAAAVHVEIKRLGNGGLPVTFFHTMPHIPAEQLHLITSAKKVMFSPVCLSVCLSVSMITQKLMIKTNFYNGFL